MNLYRSVVAIAAVLIAAAGIGRPLTASAQSPEMGAAGPAPTTYTHPVSVLRCDPQRTVSTSPVYAGYGPGFYGGPYWVDPWGARFYQPAVPTTVSETGTLYLDYKNATAKVMGTIDFGLVANGRLVAEVRDVGTFSPGIEIKHSFGLSPNVFPLQTGLPRCVALHIIFKDGEKWKNPNLPHHDKTIYH